MDPKFQPVQFEDHVFSVISLDIDHWLNGDGLIVQSGKCVNCGVDMMSVHDIVTDKIQNFAKGT